MINLPTDICICSRVAVALLAVDTAVSARLVAITLEMYRPRKGPQGLGYAVEHVQMGAAVLLYSQPRYSVTQSGMQKNGQPWLTLPLSLRTSLPPREEAHAKKPLFQCAYSVQLMIIVC